jgi:hypothetical protein
MNSLHSIGEKYQTDKSAYHMYLDFYEKYLNKDYVNRFLEIGVQSGNSMKMWREWLKSDCIVEGWDILECDKIPGVDIRVVDQLNREQVFENTSGIYDVILDDGGHTKEMIESSFAYLFSTSKFYIMEDLHAPWTGSHYLKDSEIPTLDLVLNFNKYGWVSNYGNKKELEYINKNAQLLDVFVRGEKESPLSAAAIFVNKENI